MAGDYIEQRTSPPSASVLVMQAIRIISAAVSLNSNHRDPHELSAPGERSPSFFYGGTDIAGHSRTVGALCCGAQPGSRPQGWTGLDFRHLHRDTGTRGGGNAWALGPPAFFGDRLLPGEVCGRCVPVLFRNQEIPRTPHHRYRGKTRPGTPLAPGFCAGCCGRSAQSQDSALLLCLPAAVRQPGAWTGELAVLSP